MGILLPIAGGKGGVGKSVVSLNLAVAFAQQCKNTILVDLDLGGANLHTMLGLKNNQAGLGTYITGVEKDFSALLQATGIPGLQFIAGDCLFPGTANMDFLTKKKIIKKLENLDCDYVILDLGAGSAYNVLDFYLTVYNGILVVTPELTSILNAYSFVKSAVFRFCYRLFPTKSPERTILQNSVLQRMEGKDYSFQQIISVIADKFPESGEKLFSEMQKLHPRVIMNMGKSCNDTEMGTRLKNLIKNKLSIDIEYVGFLPADETISFSIARRQPIYLSNKDSAFCNALTLTAQRLLDIDNNPGIFLEDAQESLEDIIKNYYQKQQKQEN